MKILHISYSDHHGSEKIIYNLNQGLVKKNINSKLLVLRKKTNATNVFQINEKKSFWEKILRFYKYKKYKYEVNKYFQNIPQKLAFSHINSIYSIENHPLVKDADIIHLHWTPGLINYNRFFETTKKKKIVITCHDMNHITGGCHLLQGCEGYKNKCGKCPQLNSFKDKDLSRKIFQRKESSYFKKKLNIISPSIWMKNILKESCLFRNQGIKVIPHGISTNIYKKHDKKLCRNILNLPEKSTLILFGSNYQSKIKGFEYLIKALEILAKKGRDFKLLVFGANQIKHSSEILENRIINLGSIVNEELLPIIYSSADITVVPSLEEVFGLICLESISCGTPVVGFDNTGIEEIVKNNISGLLARKGDFNHLSEQIDFLILNDNIKNRLSISGQEYVKKHLNIDFVINRHVNFYRNL
jgi:glycosyltransferase involved in cell wall biosynthesis